MPPAPLSPPRFPLPPLRLAVTGGRAYPDRDAVWQTLDATHACLPIAELAHGACVDRTGALCGADGHADGWALARGYVLDTTLHRYPADWTRHPRAAGPIRNRMMLRNFAPGVLIAFPGGNGTADCVRAAQQLGICVLDLREVLNLRERLRALR